MSAIWARLGQWWKEGDDIDDDSDTKTLVSEPADIPTHPERRPDAFKYFGRGGIGNIKRASQSRDTRPIDGPDDFSHTRGREPVIHPDRVFSVGRGGTGNIRSCRALRDAWPVTEDAAEAEYQAKLVRERTEVTNIRSSGRGGAGNISGSRSRGRKTVMYYSTRP